VNNVKLSDKLDRLAWDLALDELPLKGAVLVLRDELAHEARELEARADGVDRVVLVPEAPIPTDLFPPLPGEPEPPPTPPARKRGQPKKPRCKVTTQMIDAVIYHAKRDPSLASAALGKLVGCSETTAFVIRHGGYDRDTAKMIKPKFKVGKKSA
jgi:hypothetical protein